VHPLPPGRISGPVKTLVVALVVPLRGPAGVFGPSCELAAQLAVEELNAVGGVLGREVRLIVVDGGASAEQVAAEVEVLVSMRAVDAVVGWHTSAVRKALVPRIAGRVPYVYTAQYEGGERTPGVFLTGETDAAQLLPAMRLLAEETGVRRWCTVGNDYVWPRVTARAARRYARECGGRVRGEAFVPLGTYEFGPVLRRVERCEADAVLMLLVGDDAARFNRAFAAHGLHQRCLRLSTHMDENILLATGAEATEGLWAATSRPSPPPKALISAGVTRPASAWRLPSWAASASRVSKAYDCSRPWPSGRGRSTWAPCARWTARSRTRAREAYCVCTAITSANGCTWRGRTPSTSTSSPNSDLPTCSDREYLPSGIVSTGSID